MGDQDGMGRCWYSGVMGSEAKCPRSKLGKSSFAAKSKGQAQSGKSDTEPSQEPAGLENGNSPGNKRRPGVVATEIELPVNLASLVLNLASHTRVTTRTTGPAGFKPYHEGGENKDFIIKDYNPPCVVHKIVWMCTFSRDC